MGKRPLGIDVLTAAQQRLGRVFDDFPRIILSFSGGKDSSVLLQLAAVEARRRGRKIAVLFVDLEAQYANTIDFIASELQRWQDVLDVFWVALPINLRNAVSQYEPQWMCWDPDQRDKWVREPHPMSITDEGYFPFFRRRMEFEEFVPAFSEWYASGKLTASLVGIRTDESLNRYRAIAGRTQTFEGLPWTTRSGRTVYNAYAIYDWSTEDIWTYVGKTRQPYNKIYDLMHQAGLTIHQARICQPYGDDQRKGLWLFHILEPATWGRVVARVSGANQGALYVQESGNIMGQRKINKPAHLTWEQFAHLLLSSMPEATAENFRNKIAVFLKWYQDRGYSFGIPDDGSSTDRTKPSWARVCKAILRNDYWCKGLSFSQHKTEAFAKYQKLMKRRRSEWKII